jgi:hypothetical protein
LTENIGVRALVSQCYEVIGMEECTDMRELRDKVARHYGRQVVQFTLSLPPKHASLFGSDDQQSPSPAAPIKRRWSIFKRGIVGSFHKVSKKYMPLYVAEFQFRYNRMNADIFGTATKGC